MLTTPLPPAAADPSLTAASLSRITLETHGDTNLVAHLRSQFDVYGDSRSFTYLRESGRELVEEVTTFRELDRGAREVAAWLSSQPETNRPVVLLFEPGVDFWRAFLGCLYAGVVAVPAPLMSAA